MLRFLRAATLAVVLFVPATAEAEPDAKDPQGDDPAAYRGRTNHTTFEEGILWVPRILFFPFHLLAEYGFRRPTYAIAAWADRERVAAIVDHILRPTPRFSWSPIVVFDLGVEVGAGATMTLRN